MTRGDVLMAVTTGSERYGPLQENLHFDLVEGYTALVGANNAGKSALLQLIFRSLFGEGGTFGAEKIALIPSDRQHVAASNETAGGTLASFNAALNGQLAQQPMPHEAAQPDRPQLARLLMTHTDSYEQQGRAREILRRLGLPSVRVGQGGVVRFDEN